MELGFPPLSPERLHQTGYRCAPKSRGKIPHQAAETQPLWAAWFLLRQRGPGAREETAGMVWAHAAPGKIT